MDNRMLFPLTGCGDMYRKQRAHQTLFGGETIVRLTGHWRIRGTDEALDYRQSQPVVDYISPSGYVTLAQHEDFTPLVPLPDAGYTLTTEA